MKQYLFICSICIGIFISTPTLNVTSICIYEIINKSKIQVKIPNHNIILEKEDYCFLENAGRLKKIEIEVETEDDLLEFKFKPLENNCRIEVYQDNERVDVAVYGPWDE